MKSKEIVEKEKVLPDATIQNALMRLVERTDIDPERLEKFLDLQLKMEERQAEKAFNDALASFQGECPIIPKSKTVNFKSKTGNVTTYDYAPLDEIVHTASPILNRHGLSFSFDVRVENNLTTLYTIIRHRLGHQERYVYVFDTIHDDARMNSSQRRKSALTFAKRAGLENALGIVTQGEDDDARRAVDDPIGNETLEQVRRMMKDTDTKESDFLKFMKISSLEDMSSYEGKRAVSALKQKRIKNVQTNKL